MNEPTTKVVKDLNIFQRSYADDQHVYQKLSTFVPQL